MTTNSQGSDMKTPTDELVDAVWSTPEGAAPAEVEEAPPGHPLVCH